MAPCRTQAEPATGPVRRAALATSRKNALCKGFETDDDVMTKVEIPGVGKGLNNAETKVTAGRDLDLLAVEARGEWC
jgi:hypothetical protein